MRIFFKLAVDLFPTVQCLRGWKEKSFILWGLFPASSKPRGWAEGRWTGGDLLPFSPSSLSRLLPQHLQQHAQECWRAPGVDLSCGSHLSFVPLPAGDRRVICPYGQHPANKHTATTHGMNQLDMHFNFITLEGKKLMFFLWTLLSSRESHPICNHC